MNGLTFVVLALAVWRLASLVVMERGPFDLFLRLRARAGIQHDDNGAIQSYPETFVAGVLACVWCLSVWLGLCVAFLAYVAPLWAFWLCLPFALSAAAIVLERWVR